MSTTKELGMGETEEHKRVSAWLEAMQTGRLNPPRDVHDAGAWDQYWINHLEVGPSEQGFADRLASRKELPELLMRRGARTVLCAGNGLSLEAFSLALLGFHATALDISSVPARVFQTSLQHPEHPVRQLPGFRMREDGSVAFETDELIEAEGFPPMHSSDKVPARGGGSLSFATGDLVTASVCPGPFDAVIERRTVQLFPPAEHEAALERLVARLPERGTFVSQQHDGAWRPGKDRIHYAQAWLESHGFRSFMRAGGGEEDQPRLAWLIFTSG